MINTLYFGSNNFYVENNIDAILELYEIKR